MPNTAPPSLLGAGRLGSQETLALQRFAFAHLSWPFAAHLDQVREGILAEDVAEFGGRARTDEAGYFRTLATVMAIVQVAGFVVQLAVGRSSFAAPLVVHLHAVVFMGWVAIFLAQPWLVAKGLKDQHRLLGRIALVWSCAVFILGVWVTWENVRGGRTPFFFQPQLFLVANPVTLVAALALFATAVHMRKRQDWHARLQIGSFMLLMGPSFGRMLPMPFLTPYAFEIAAAAPLIFAAVAAGRDALVRKAVHPAWGWALGVLAAALLLARVIGESPLGAALYAAAVAGTGLAGSDGMAFPPPPPMP